MSEEKQYTVSEILDRYARDCMHDLAPRTQADYRRHLPVLHKWFGARIANELKPRDFAEFMNVNRGKQQRNKQLAILSSAFTNAVGRWFWMDVNILRGVIRHPSKPRDRLVLPEEFAGVRSLTYEPIRLVMELALVTGQRQGDVLSFKWSDIKDGALHLQQTKTGKRLAIVLTLDLKRLLGRCWKMREGFDEPEDRIIINTRGRGYTSDGFRSCWQRNMRAYVRRGGERYTFHDLRAMCATSFGTVEEAGRLLGHASPSMTRKVYRRGIERVQPLQLRHEPKENHTEGVGGSQIRSAA